MEEFFTILIVVLIVFFRIGRINQVKVRNEYEGRNAINNLLESGEWITGPGGQPMPRERAFYLEKVNHLDFKYIINRNLKTEIQLSYMSLSEIKEVAKLHRESEEKKKQENEEKAKRQTEERKRWRNPKNHFIFEIDEYNGMQPGVYIIYNQTSEEYYIGSSLNMHKRKLQHLSGLRKNNHPSKKLQRSFREYGEDCLRFYALLLVDFADEINKTGFSHHSDLTNERKKGILESKEQEMFNRFNPKLNGYTNIQQWKKESAKYYNND